MFQFWCDKTKKPKRIIPFIPIKSWNAVSKGPEKLPGSTSQYLNIKGAHEPNIEAVIPATCYAKYITKPSKSPYSKVDPDIICHVQNIIPRIPPDKAPI